MMNKDLLQDSTVSYGSSRYLILYNDSTIIIDGGWTATNNSVYYALFKTDTLGSIHKTSYLPDPDNIIPSWITKTYDNKIIFLGMNFVGGSSRFEFSKFNSDLEYDSIYTRQFTYDSLCPHPIVSDTIVPNCGIVGIDEALKNPETAALKVYPNPASGNVTVEFPKHLVVKNGDSSLGSTTVYERWKSTILEVYDLSGKSVYKKEIIRAETSMEMDVSGWQPGMYYFKLSYNGRTVTGKKVVIN
jgi:hypothetical protein